MFDDDNTIYFREDITNVQFHKKNRKGLTQWNFVTLGPTIVYTTRQKRQTLTTKP